MEGVYSGGGYKGPQDAMSGHPQAYGMHQPWRVRYLSHLETSCEFSAEHRAPITDAFAFCPLLQGAEMGGGGQQYGHNLRMPQHAQAALYHHGR